MKRTVRQFAIEDGVKQSGGGGGGDVVDDGGCAAAAICRPDGLRIGNLRRSLLLGHRSSYCQAETPLPFLFIRQKNVCSLSILMYTAKMKTLAEIGQALAEKRKSLGLKQGQVAEHSGLSQALLSRLERGQLTEFGSRKLLALLAVLEMELAFTEAGTAGNLDELRRERGGA